MEIFSADQMYTYTSHVVRSLLCIRDPRDMLLFLTCKRNPV